MFPTDHDFRRYAIAQATAKRIATQIAQQIEPCIDIDIAIPSVQRMLRVVHLLGSNSSGLAP